MTHLLRLGIDGLPAPLPLWVRDGFRFVRYPQVRDRRRAHRQILDRLPEPGRVAQGPFRGMHYLALAYCSEILPKILGTYESELAPAIEAICRADCDRIVDIGAAEGYYAVGMALRNPGAVVVGFEVDRSARFYLRRLARRNRVSGRIRLRGECDVDSLREAMAGARRPAVICDCEGAEDRLLDPDRVESLRQARILVETHDGLITESGPLAGITDRIAARFAPTHRVETIASRVRVHADLPPGCPLSFAEASEAMDEGRPWARWLFLEPKPDIDGQ